MSRYSLRVYTERVLVSGLVPFPVLETELEEYAMPDGTVHPLAFPVKFPFVTTSLPRAENKESLFSVLL